MAATAGDPIDIHVGQRFKVARTMAGVTQQTLGEAVGICWQQVQKYEQGVNRIAASRLWKIAAFLNVSVLYFFEGLETKGHDGAATRQMLEVVKVWLSLTERQQRDFMKLMKSVNAPGNEREPGAERADVAGAASPPTGT